MLTKPRTTRRIVGNQVAWVSKDRRVVIDLDTVQAALGLKLSPGESIDLWAITGSLKQIQILPPKSELAKSRASYEEAPKRELPWNKSDGDEAEISRRLEDFYRIRCRARTQSRSCRLTLPREAIDLDLLRTNEALVLVIIGDVVELWRRDRWTEMAAIQDLDKFTERVRDMLDNDE